MKNHYKTLFISDTHLGSRTANATVLLDFLRNNHCDKLFIIGDFIDFWAMKRSVYFPPTHREIIRIILKWSARGVYIEYIPGNHDDDIRTFLPIFLDNVQVVRESTHTTKNGKRFLITHGDDYDQVIKYAKWLAWLGDVGYHGLIYANKFVNFCRMHFGYGHWSLSAWVKQKVKTAVNIIGDYETAIVKDVVGRGLDGVICGHIHFPELRDLNGIIYANCGDFVENCTAIAENADGSLKLIDWRTEMIKNRLIILPAAE